jgi:hypothetical protein
VVARIDARWGAVPTALCAGLLIVACSGAGPVASPQPQASGSPAVPVAVSVTAARARYVKIAEAGNRRLEHDFDRLEDEDHSRLAAARADLRDAAATEHLFDRRLLAIRLPPPADGVARILYRVNQSRARLTLRAARSTSVRQLHAYLHRLEDANKPVESAVQVIRSILGLPPPDTS